MSALIVSLVAGVAFPLLPILAEYGITHEVLPETYSLTALVYAAAVGMASRQQAVGISGPFSAALCAIIYGAVKVGARDHPGAPFVQHASLISGAILFFYVSCWIVERFGRHYIDREPFLEF